MKIISYLREPAPWIEKPDTCLLRNDDAYYLPPFEGAILARAYFFVRITRMVKAIGLSFAGRCYEEGGVAVEFVAAGVLDRCRAKAYPWEPAFSYDKSTAVPDTLCPVEGASAEVVAAGKTLFAGPIPDLRERIDRAVADASLWVTLKVGDYVMIPLSDETAAITIGDRVQAVCSGMEQLNFDCK